MAISILFALGNGVAHILLFITPFNYPNTWADVCLYALIATWLFSFLITKKKEDDFDSCIVFIKETKVMFIVFLLFNIYVISFAFWGLFKYQLLFISFFEPITPERAKIVSAGYVLFFYLPIWLLYPLIKTKKDAGRNNAFNTDAE